MNIGLRIKGVVGVSVAFDARGAVSTIWDEQSATREDLRPGTDLPLAAVAPSEGKAGSPDLGLLNIRD